MSAPAKPRAADRKGRGAVVGSLISSHDKREEIVYDMEKLAAIHAGSPRELGTARLRCSATRHLPRVIRLMGFYTSVSMTLAFDQRPAGRRGDGALRINGRSTATISCSAAAGDFRPDERRVISRTIAGVTPATAATTAASPALPKASDTMNEADPVKSAVAAHWNRRAPTFDSDFGHSIVTVDQRGRHGIDLWPHSGGRSGLDALDVGRGTGISSFELAARGHRVLQGLISPPRCEPGAPKDGAHQRLGLVQQGDAENLPFTARVFDPVPAVMWSWTFTASRGRGGGVGAEQLPGGRRLGRARQPI